MLLVTGKLENIFRVRFWVENIFRFLHWVENIRIQNVIT